MLPSAKEVNRLVTFILASMASLSNQTHLDLTFILCRMNETDEKVATQVFRELQMLMRKIFLLQTLREPTQN